MMTKEGSTKIINFMNPGAGGRAWPYISYRENALSSTINIQHIDCYCIKGL